MAAKVRWMPQAQSAFEQVRGAMVRAPVMLIPNTCHDARYTMYMDAFGFAVGVVLLEDHNMYRTTTCCVTCSENEQA
jgi:hypothetical protein